MAFLSADATDQREPEPSEGDECRGRADGNRRPWCRWCRELPYEDHSRRGDDRTEKELSTLDVQSGHASSCRQHAEHGE